MTTDSPATTSTQRREPTGRGARIRQHIEFADLPIRAVNRKPKKPPRIALLGLFGCVNYGNDGSLETVMGILRNTWPEADLACICVDPAEVQREHHIRGIWINWPGFDRGFFDAIDKYCMKGPRRILNIIRTIKTVRQFDALVVPGTGILCDYRVDPLGAVYWVFRWCIAARLCGVRVCFLNVGAGPIERPLSRWMLKQVARSASYRSFRDSFSHKFITDLGVDTVRDLVYPDIVFRMPCPTTPPRILPADQPATVGVGVMWYDGWHGHRHPRKDVYEKYVSQLASFVCWLLENGHPVRLLVGEATDKPVAVSVKEQVQKLIANQSIRAELAAEPIDSLHDLMREIARTDIVVASRYHNIICALKLGRPTISISYAVKHDELMERAGMGRFCHHIETLSLDRLRGQFREIVANRPVYEALLADRIEQFQHHLELQERALLQAIQPP